MDNIDRMNRLFWLERKRELLTASEVAAVLGIDPYNTALDVYVNKQVGYSYEQRECFEFGHDIEEPLARMYSRRTGRQVVDLGATEIQVHPDIPWLGATLDRQVTREDGIKGPLELKSVAGKRAAEWTEDSKPDHNQVQVQIQMACTSATWGALAGLVWGTDMLHEDYDYKPEFFEAAYPYLEEFWGRVQRHDPPPVTSPRCLQAIKRLYSKDDGEIVVLGKEHVDLVARRDALNAEKKAMEDEKDEIDAKIRAVMGEATFGALPDGRFVSLKTQKRDGYTVQPTTFRVMRIVKSIK
jgi:putative phage-type endonuclease